MKKCSCGQYIENSSFVAKLGKPSVKTPSNTAWIMEPIPAERHYNGEVSIITKWVCMVWSLASCQHVLTVTDGKWAQTPEEAHRDALQIARGICNYDQHTQLSLFS